MILTLQTGIQVTLRPVDLDARTPLTLRDAMAAAYAQVGAQHAKAAGERLARQLGPDHKPRPADSDAAGSLLRAGRDLEVSLLRRALVQPTLPDLMAAYGGSEDDADLGLGPDYATLMQAVRTLSDLSEPAPAELERAGVFLREWAPTLDAMSKRYGMRPSAYLPDTNLPERDRLALDLGVYYWSRGEDALDEAWRRREEDMRRGSR